MELEIVCKETIKPFSPTPPELRHLPLSFLDKYAPYIYLQILYFFEKGGGSGGRRLLKESLSKALTHYYPFAGRLKDDLSAVDCNDMGATFLETKLPCRISEVMFHNLQRDEILNLVSSDDWMAKDQRFDPLLSVQLTQFQCGGESICVLLSHKLADASTFVNFMNHWASIARGGAPPPPQFNAASLFGDAANHNDRLMAVEGSKPLKRDESIVSKRFVFEGSKIAALKAMVSEKVKNPSRVQVVTALIRRAAISASFSVAVDCPERRPATALLLTVDLRTKVVPPFPSTLAGNVVSFFVASSTGAETEMELWSMVGEMKRNTEEFTNKWRSKYKGGAAATGEWESHYWSHMKETMEKLSSQREQSFYSCTSWCRFPLYETDFGWGKPIWIASPFILQKNVIALLDARDGEGIEALVSLEKNQMEAFERDQELLSFCELDIKT